MEYEAKLLKGTEGTLGDNLKRLVKWAIENQFDPDTHMAILWSVYDVMHVHPDLTIAQARQVLDHIEEKHDASLGISLESIEDVATDMFPISREENQ